MDTLTLSWLHSPSLLPDDEQCHQGLHLAHTHHRKGKKEQWIPTPPTQPPHFPSLEVFSSSRSPFAPLLSLTLLWSHHAVAWSEAAAFWEWTETFERASCSLCHRLQGLDSSLLVSPCASQLISPHPQWK